MTDDDGNDGFFSKFLNQENGVGKIVFDVLIALVIVAIVGGLLFTYTGVWPPFINIGSGSMEPNMETGSVVIVMDTEKNVPDGIVSHNGVVTKHEAQNSDYESFSEPGDVIVLETDAISFNIIHRSHLHVEEGEDWFDRANDEYLNTNNCEAQEFCPAPHDGFITKGDANDVYDQASGIEPVKEEDVQSKAVRTVFPFW